MNDADERFKAAEAAEAAAHAALKEYHARSDADPQELEWLMARFEEAMTETVAAAKAANRPY